MYRRLMLIACVAVLSTAVLHAQARFTINAASEEAVPGWQRMEIEGRTVWVNPTPALTAADIQGAEPATDPNFGNLVKVVFSDAGAQKMRVLTKAQMDKLIAMLLDGKLISAPRVRSVISTDGVITGKPPSGLSVEEVRRILTSVNQKQK